VELFAAFEVLNLIDWSLKEKMMVVKGFVFDVLGFNNTI